MSGRTPSRKSDYGDRKNSYRSRPYSNRNTRKESVKSEHDFGLDSQINPIFESSDIPSEPTKRGIKIYNFTNDYSILCQNDTNDTVLSLEQESKFRQSHTIPPFIEYLRGSLIQQIRQKYEKKCRDLFHFDAPFESFNRWLFEQLSVPKEKAVSIHEPIMKKPDVALQGDVITQQIIDMFPRPIKLRFKTAAIAVSEIKNYCMDVKEEIEKNSSAEDPNLAQVKAQLMTQLQTTEKSISGPYFENLDEYRFITHALKEKVTQYFALVLKPQLNALCQFLVDEAHEYLKIMEQKIKEEIPSDKVVVDFSDEHGLPSRTFCNVSYRQDKHKIYTLHYNKLKHLYKIHNSNYDPELKFFEDNFYVLIKRYHTFFGNPDKGEGVNFHAALTEDGFDWLRQKLHIQQECFASPLNCYFARFCSAFFDIDVKFGSRGSFFDFNPIEGSFECGPPYTLEIMNACASHVIKLCKSSDRPLSFVVFVPEWTNTYYGDALHPDNCSFTRSHLLLEKSSYNFVSGSQHLKKGSDQKDVEEESDRYWESLPFATHVYFVQNDQGYQKWPAPQELADAFKTVILHKK